MPGQAEVLLEVDVPRPLHVAADEQIEVAVVLGVEPRGARAPLVGAAAHPGRRGHVVESAADVLEQGVAADRGYEQVDPAVVVVVAGGQAHPIGVEGEAGHRGPIHELAVAVVEEQRERRHPRRRRPRRPRPGPAVHEQQIEVAVVVDVDQAAPAAGRLGQQLLALGAVLARDPGQTGLGGDVDEAGRRRRRHRPDRSPPARVRATCGPTRRRKPSRPTKTSTTTAAERRSAERVITDTAATSSGRLLRRRRRRGARADAADRKSPATGRRGWPPGWPADAARSRGCATVRRACSAGAPRDERAARAWSPSSPCTRLSA